MKFTTETGSIYEVDTDAHCIRRLGGKSGPTNRQGPDGSWRSYDRLYPDVPTIGSVVMIAWGAGTPLLEGSPEGATPTTITSVVRNVEPSPDA